MAKDKMQIVAYKDNKYSGKGFATCDVKISPSSYTHNHSVRYNNKTPVGAPGTVLKFDGVPPETVSFDIHFDATGAIEENTDPVKAQLDNFKTVCFTYNGKIHEPNFLIVSWGVLVFKCKLTSLNISYTLFKKDGTPLRAKASVSFEEATDANMLAKEAGPESPDLTHLVEIQEGDTLPLICSRMYGDPSYYLDVAKFNNIVNFRRLKAGMKIYLPSLK